MKLRRIGSRQELISVLLKRQDELNISAATIDGIAGIADAYSQNRRFRIACRRGGGRSSTRGDPGAGCRAGRRPCVDRKRLSIGCCTSRDRRRSTLPACQAGNCLSIVWVAAKPSAMIPRPTT
jgi:hypothetical protein